jgi:polyisoprenyl-teichoic acid--peptidoglycan teichoic acid transferase
MRRMRRILLAVTAAVGALILGIGAMGAAWLAGIRIPVASGATYLRVQKIAPLATANQAGSPSGMFFALLVGNDSRPGVGGARGDALHLLGVNPATNTATMIDIPRDTCWQGDKINVGNTHGPRAQANAVGGLVGVPVSYVVDVDFAGFTSLVDGVGGVTVNVPTPMHDVYSGAYFSPGPIHMSGDQALRFSRDRHDFPQSDIIRTHNQGLLLLDAFRQLDAQMQNAAGEFRLMALLGRHAQLDGMGLSDLLRLGRIAFRLNPNTIRQVTVPTAGGNCLALAGNAPGLFADFRDDATLESH